jgi:hypothetical protein
MNINSVNSQFGKQSFNGFINLKGSIITPGIINFSNIKGVDRCFSNYNLFYENVNGEKRSVPITENEEEAKAKLSAIIQANNESDRTGKVVDVTI